MTEAPDTPAWESVQEELAARGTIVIQGHLDLGLATQAAARLMEHDAVSDRAARVRLYTSSGEFGAALTVMDTLAALGVVTEVTAVGAVQGPGLVVLAVAGRRVAAPNCLLAFAAPRIQVEGPVEVLARFLEVELRDQQRWLEQVAQATGRPFELVEADLGSALALPPEAALRYRLIDEVLGSPGSPVGSVK